MGRTWTARQEVMVNGRGENNDGVKGELRKGRSIIFFHVNQILPLLRVFSQTGDGEYEAAGERARAARRRQARERKANKRN